MDTIIKALAINTGVEPIFTEKFDIAAADVDLVKSTIVSKLNAMGKSSHILIKFGGHFWTLNHTAPRGPSKTYTKMKIDYHPMMKELA